MRVKLAALTGLLPLLLGGCIVFPTGRAVVSGSDYPHEAIAFLDLPDASREETIATLGPPSWESTNSRVLLYLYETAINWHTEPIPVEIGHQPVEFVNCSNDLGTPKLWGLFVAYDTNGLVIRHAIGHIRYGTPDDHCVDWARNPRKMR
jgi:hypothetical protein